MNRPETSPIWRTLPTKLRVYEAIRWLNRSFEATLLSLERIEGFGIFRLEYLNEYKVRIGDPMNGARGYREDTALLQAFTSFLPGVQGVRKPNREFTLLSG